MTDAFSYALYFSCGKTSGPKATRDYRPRSSTFLGLQRTTQKIDINKIRLNLGLVLTLGLEFIIAADLIGTTTAPDYYSVGIVASIVLIRMVLSYTLNKEINSISKMEQQN